MSIERSAEALAELERNRLRAHRDQWKICDGVESLERIYKGLSSSYIDELVREAT